MRHACLFVAIAWMACGCAHDQESADPQGAQAALADFREAVLRQVQDPARAQEISSIIDQLERRDRQARETVATYRRRLELLNANYDATDEDFGKLFAEFNDERVAHQHRIVDLWTRMAGLMTDPEWDALASTRNAAATALSSRG